MDPIPWEIAAPVVGALVTAIGALWRDRNHWQRKWASEVKATAPVLRRFRRSMEAGVGRPTSDPPDAWDDNTEVRSRMLSEDRRWIDQAAVDTELRQYLESTPPRQRKP